MDILIVRRDNWDLSRVSPPAAVVLNASRISWVAKQVCNKWFKILWLRKR